jgi:hypothetical protein
LFVPSDGTVRIAVRQPGGCPSRSLSTASIAPRACGDLDPSILSSPAVIAKVGFNPS